MPESNESKVLSIDISNEVNLLKSLVKEKVDEAKNEIKEPAEENNDNVVNRDVRKIKEEGIPIMDASGQESEEFDLNDVFFETEETDAGEIEIKTPRESIETYKTSIKIPVKKTIRELIKSYILFSTAYFNKPLFSVYFVSIKSKKDKELFENFKIPEIDYSFLIDTYYSSLGLFLNENMHNIKQLYRLLQLISKHKEKYVYAIEFLEKRKDIAKRRYESEKIASLGNPTVNLKLSKTEYLFYLSFYNLLSNLDTFENEVPDISMLSEYIKNKIYGDIPLKDIEMVHQYVKNNLSILSEISKKMDRFVSDSLNLVSEKKQSRSSRSINAEPSPSRSAKPSRRTPAPPSPGGDPLAKQKKVPSMLERLGIKKVEEDYEEMEEEASIDESDDLIVDEIYIECNVEIVNNKILVSDPFAENLTYEMSIENQKEKINLRLKKNECIEINGVNPDEFVNNLKSDKFKSDEYQFLNLLKVYLREIEAMFNKDRITQPADMCKLDVDFVKDFYLKLQKADNQFLLFTEFCLLVISKFGLSFVEKIIGEIIKYFKFNDKSFIRMSYLFINY